MSQSLNFTTSPISKPFFRSKPYLPPSATPHLSLRFPKKPITASLSDLNSPSFSALVSQLNWSSSSDSTSIEVDSVTEAELKENGFRSTRRTKLICTIGPATCGFEQLEALAVGGMNVARINMCHGTREWHKMVIERVRRLNEEKGYAVAVMMDTEGSEIHMGDLGGAQSAKAEVIFG